MASNLMDWTYPDGSDDAGIFEIGRQLAVAIGRAPDLTRFIYDPRAMLRTTREIEAAARGHRLLVGFQTAAKFEVEHERYRDIVDAGTSVTAWAAGSVSSEAAVDGVDYRALKPNTQRLENQWFLVADGPEQLAFVSYELGDAAAFGVGGAASPGKRFVGFVSDDPAVVDLLIQSMAPIAAPPAPSAPRGPSDEAVALVDASVDSADEPRVVAGPGAVLVTVGRGTDRAAFIAALTLARRDGRVLVMIDRAAEGIASPYHDLRGDDAGRPAPDRLFDESLARREGRGSLATYLEAAAVAGVSAGGWFPTHAGLDGLIEAKRRFNGAVVVLPPEAGRPGLAERVRGMTPARIGAALNVPVVIAS